MSADTRPTSLQSLVRVRDLARQRAEQQLSLASAECANLATTAQRAEAALEGHDREPPAQPAARVNAGALKRQGAMLRAHQQHRAELRAGLAKARCDVAMADARLREARDVLAVADAEYRVAQQRLEGHERAGQRRRRAAEDDAIDDLTAVHARRQR